MYLECDYDGRILFVNDDLKKNFNYVNDDFVKTNRIFNLIHSDSVVYFIDFFNSFLSNNLIHDENNFILIGSNNKIISCNIALKKSNFIIKFIVLTYSENVESNLNLNTFIKNFIFLTRSKFILGSLMPFLFAISWGYYRYNNASYLLLFLSFVGLCLLHICANTLNDYFDWISGRDKKNIDYVLLSTGGSRSIDFKIISQDNMFYLSLFFLFIVLLIGCYLIYLKGLLILLIGLLALFAVYFYSAPPIHLASRHGLGELFHIICLGPVIIYATLKVVFDSGDFLDFLIGIPHGLLITACLLINEYPDSNSDKLFGKNNLAVFLGKKYIPYFYAFLVILSFLVVFTILLFFSLPFYFLFVFFLIPHAFSLCKFIFIFGLENRKGLQISCEKSLKFYLYYSIIVILASFLSFF